MHQPSADPAALILLVVQVVGRGSETPSVRTGSPRKHELAARDC